MNYIPTGEMITIYFKDKTKRIRNASPGTLKDLDKDAILWIDLMLPDAGEHMAVEDFIGRSLLTREQAEEIESTSKYSETKDAIISNSNYYVPGMGSFDIDPTSFIITKEGILVSHHHLKLHPFLETERRLEIDPEANKSGYHVFITSMESLIDHDADMVELVSKHITKLSEEISGAKTIDVTVLHRINALQENTMALRENIFDLQRVLSGILRSQRFPADIHSRLELMLKDIDSLIGHGDISFQRLDYMQDTALGIINIEQNEVVKILSVAAVIFMPPTLIASIYGMNFKVIPELNWLITLKSGTVIPAGYLFAIILMVVVTLLTYLFFRYKKWL